MNINVLVVIGNFGEQVRLNIHKIKNNLLFLQVWTIIWIAFNQQLVVNDLFYDQVGH